MVLADKNYFTLWFFNGVFLKDEGGFLVNAPEGVTKSLRQWRFTSKEKLNEKLILEYIYEAIENEKNGKIPPVVKKSKSFVVPYILKSAVDARNLSEHFSKFSSFRQ